MLSVICTKYRKIGLYAECHYAERHYVECSDDFKVATMTKDISKMSCLSLVEHFKGHLL
jgi:hypothetical protein